MKPNNFPLRTNLDGSEEIYSQTSGVSEKFTLEQAKDYIRPYKVYTALLTQSGNDAPVATVLENTIGNIVWSRTSDGVYYATLVGAFPDENKFFTLNSITEISSSNVSVYWNDTDSFQLNTYSGNGFSQPYAPQDGIIFKYPIEIRVYN
jgi:hypothetical protein